MNSSIPTSSAVFPIYFPEIRTHEISNQRAMKSKYFLCSTIEFVTRHGMELRRTSDPQMSAVGTSGQHGRTLRTATKVAKEHEEGPLKTYESRGEKVLHLKKNMVFWGVRKLSTTWVHQFKSFGLFCFVGFLFYLLLFH